MSFNKVAKISLALSALICTVNAAENVSLNSVEVTSSSGGYQNVDEAKVTTRNAGLVKDILRDIPGIYVGGTNGPNQKIYMRGVSDRGLNITIDGAKQNGNTFHHNADLLIDPDLIKAVETQVGSRSVVNGAGALGGSVAFKTVDASDLLEDGQTMGAKLKAGYATNNKEFSKGVMLYTHLFDSLDILAAINHKNYDHGKSGNDKKIGGDGRDLSYLFKVGYSFLDAHKITVSHEHNEYKGMYPFRAEFGSWHTGANSLVDTKYERDTTTLKYGFNPSDILDLELVGYVTEHKRVSDTTWGVETKGLNVKAKTKLTSGDIMHTLRYGAQYYRSQNANKPTNVRAEKVDNYSLYLEDAVKFGDLTVTPGVRYERHELKTYNGIGANIGDYKYKFDEISPAIALDYEIGKGFGAFASYAKVFRGPDVIESLYASGVSRGAVLGYKGNDNLKATTGDAYEFGGRYKGELSEDVSLNFVAKYFKTEYKNLIVDNNAERGRLNTVLMRINSGGADIDGFEIWGRLNVQNLSLAASYTHQKVKYKDRVKNTSGNYYTSNVIGYRDQGDKYTFNAEYSIPAVDILLGYNLVFFDSKNTISAGDNKEVKMPSYAVNDFYATYAPSAGRFKGLEINAGLYNAFNKAYASHSQRIAEYTGETNTIDWEPGRNFKINVSYKF